jgi:hypothetical protein
MRAEPATRFGRGSRGIAVALGTIAALAVGLTWDDYGYATDEPTYRWVAAEFRTWLGTMPARGSAAFTPAAIAEGCHFLEDPAGRPAGRHSNFNFPASVHVINLGRLLGFGLSPRNADRMGSMILFGLLVGAVFLTFSRHDSPSHGLLAAGFVALSPRVFGHAHLAGTELPMITFWTLGLLAAIHALPPRDRASSAGPTGDEPALGTSHSTAIAAIGARRPGWPILFALFAGLAAATKLNCWLAAAPIGLWLLLVRPGGWLRCVGWSLVLVPALVIGLTPNLWHDPIGGLSQCLRTTLTNPWKIAAVWGGRAFTGDMPGLATLSIVALTTPVATLGFGLLGALLGWRDRARPLVIVNLITVVGARLAGLMPQHDVDRQFLPAWVFLAILAGLTVADLVRWLTGRWRGMLRTAAFGVLGSLGLLEPALETWTYRGHGLCYFNAIAGGIEGADRAGHELSYWQETMTDERWSSLFAGLADGTRVFLRPDHPGMDELRAEGVIPPRVTIVGAPEEADVMLLTARRAAAAVPDANGRFVLTDLVRRLRQDPAIREVRWRGVRLAGLFRQR